MADTFINICFSFFTETKCVTSYTKKITIKRSFFLNIKNVLYKNKIKTGKQLNADDKKYIYSQIEKSEIRTK